MAKGAARRSTAGREAGSRVAVILTALLLVAAAGACSTSRSGVAKAAAFGALHAWVDDLGAGRLDALPSGPLFIRVVDFVQGPDSEFGSQKHQAGFEFQLDGVQQLSLQGGPTVVIHPGYCYFQPSVTHVHANPGPGPNHWLFIALWPSSARTTPLVVPTARSIYETEDVASDGFTNGPSVETLQRVTLLRAGHTAAVSRPGPSALLVLSGSVRVVLSGHGPSLLSAQQGAYLPAGAGSQAFDAGAGDAQFLLFSTTPTSKPFEVGVTHI
jgi:hypothetical protein